ncbi:MAG: L-threonylcarbamoyladenylate synthase [Myxococcota bacterium]
MKRVNPEEAGKLILRGELVIIPTETVYGLGADALQPGAVARIFEVKRRPRINPLIVHVNGVDMARRVAVMNRRDEQLMEDYWPGPLTLVLPARSLVPAAVTAGGPTVALRMPAHPLALSLLRATDRPIAAPSANLSGRLSPTTAEAAAEQLPMVAVLDGGPCEVGVESTVLSLVAPPRILRPGAVTQEDLRRHLPDLSDREGGEAFSSAPGLPSPGLLPRHYAPRTRLAWWTPGTAPDMELARVTFGSAAPEPGWGAWLSLSPSGDLREASHRLYETLRQLDDGRFSAILVDPIPAEGLGAALRDRLQRGMAVDP